MAAVEECLVMDIGEAARALGMGKEAAAALFDAGVLTGYRTAGGHRRFNRARVEAYAAGEVVLPVVKKPVKRVAKSRGWLERREATYARMGVKTVKGRPVLDAHDPSVATAKP